MYETISISLPIPMIQTVKVAIKSGDYTSRSEFFRDLLDEWEKSKMLKEINESREEIYQGKGRVLKSLKDLRYIF